MKNILAICIAAWALAAALPSRASARAGAADGVLSPSTAVVPACGTAAPAIPATPRVQPATDGVALTIEVRDATTQGLLSARLSVRDGAGATVAPVDPEVQLFQQIGSAGYFYGDGAVTLLVPAGPLTVRAGCGFEYVPAETTFVMDAERTVVLTLDRIANMNSLGWYAADTHVHISHQPVIYAVTPEQVITVMEAEGLNVINSMEEASYFTGALHPASTPQRLLYFSKEERNAHFAHFSLVGLKEWIRDQTCDALGHMCGRTPTWQISNLVRAQGPHTLLIATHPFPTWDLDDVSPWPGGGVWRSMSLDLLGGHVDAMDLINYTHAPPPGGAEDYLHALNLGFRVAPSAGTDATIGTGGSLPAGGYRLYTWLGAEALSFDGWVEAVRGAHSFVTNYPLVTNFTVGGARAGDELTYEGGALPVDIEVKCAQPFERVQIIAGSSVIHEIVADPGTTELSASVEVNPGDAGWVLARVRGSATGWHVVDANGLFAQTGPVYLAPPGTPSRVPDGSGTAASGIDPLEAASQRFRVYTETMVTLFSQAEFTPQGRAEFDSATAYAIDYFENAWPDPPDPFDLVSPLDVSWQHGRTWLQTTTPTFRWRHATDPDPGDTVSYEFLLDDDYTFDDPWVAAPLSDTTYTVPPEWGLEDEEIYYWRVVAVDALGNRRIGNPGWWTFIIDMVTTGAGDRAPQAWSLAPGFPNPFNPDLHVSYSVPPGSGEHCLEVFDARGRRVRILFSGRRPAGVYEALWDGLNERGEAVASGIYLIRLRPRDAAPISHKAVLLK